MPRKTDHLHTPEVRAKIAASMRGNTNGRHTRGIKKPGSRPAGVRNLIEKGVPARLASPLGGPFETNHAARLYALVSPDGERHAGNNLAHFVRARPDLFEPLDLVPEKKARCTTCRAQRKLSQLQRELHRQSWKGWTRA